VFAKQTEKNLQTEARI